MVFKLLTRIPWEKVDLSILFRTMKSKTVTLMFIFAIAVIGIAFLATNVFFNYREKREF